MDNVHLLLATKYTLFVNFDLIITDFNRKYFVKGLIYESIKTRIRMNIFDWRIMCTVSC